MLYLSIVTMADGQRWLYGRIVLPNGKKVYFCIELLYAALFSDAPTPQHPNKKVLTDGFLTGASI